MAAVHEMLQFHVRRTLSSLCLPIGQYQSHTLVNMSVSFDEIQWQSDDEKPFQPFQGISESLHVIHHNQG